MLSVSPSTMYSFTGSTDGATPSGITQDVNGNIFGVAQGGGASGLGCIWEYSGLDGGIVNTLYSFSGGVNGSGPVAVTVDANDNLFGTTRTGGTHGQGSIWELANGRNSVTTLYSFTGGWTGSRRWESQ